MSKYESLPYNVIMEKFSAVPLIVKESVFTLTGAIIIG